MSLFIRGDRLEHYHMVRSLASRKEALTQFVNLDTFCMEFPKGCDD